MIITRYKQFFESLNKGNIIEFLRSKGLDMYQYGLNDLYISIKTDLGIKLNDNSIDIWDNFSFGSLPNRTIKLSDNYEEIYSNIINSSVKEELKFDKFGDKTLDELVDDKNPIDEFFDVFDTIEKFTLQVGKGLSNALLITGQGGVGKTFVATKALKSIGMNPDKEYYKVTGQITTAGLYETLFRFRHNDNLILFDDIDSVFNNEASVNMLKGALDTSKEREIAKVTSGNTFDAIGMTDEEIQRKYEEEDKLPKKFTYEGRIIFISNIAGEKLDKALFTRTLWVDVYLTNEEIITRMKEILPFIEVNIIPVPDKPKYDRIEVRPNRFIRRELKHDYEDNISQSQMNLFKQEALDFLEGSVRNGKLKFELSIRALIHIINLRIGNRYDERIIGDIKGNLAKPWQLLARKYIIKEL